MVFVVWLASIPLTAIIASSKNRSGLAWAGWAFVGSWIALFILLLKRPIPRAGVEPTFGNATGKSEEGKDVSPIRTLEKLGALRDQGILSEEEFQLKKAEVLERV